MACRATRGPLVAEPVYICTAEDERAALTASFSDRIEPPPPDKKPDAGPVHAENLRGLGGADQIRTHVSQSSGRGPYGYSPRDE